MKKYLFLVIALLLPVSLMAQTDKDYDELKNEVQILREEVKALNNSLPFRGEPNWGTGFIVGLSWLGMSGQREVMGLEIGYSWNSIWSIRGDLDRYYDASGKNTNDYYDYSLGFILKTPLSLNLRSYVGVFLGMIKTENVSAELSSKGLIGIEFYTSRRGGFFIETGLTRTEGINPVYDSVNHGFVVGGVRLYF